MNENKALAVISFGTTFPETREKTIGAIEEDLKAAFPDRKFYRAFTSGFIRKKIREKEGLAVFSPEEMFAQMAEDGITDCLVQPTNLLAGEEFDKIENALKDSMKSFKKTTIGRPLLETEDDIREIVSAIGKIFSAREEGCVYAVMGHGSAALQIPVWDLLNREFKAQGLSEFCVGTVEFEPGIEPVLKMVREKKPEKVILSPLLVVAGDHANNDMAGDEPDSWKSQVQAEGPEVSCILKGLGEYPEIRGLYVERAKKALPLT